MKYIKHKLLILLNILMGLTAIFCVGLLINIFFLTEKRVLPSFETLKRSVHPVMSYGPQTFMNIGTSFQIKYKNQLYTITAGHVCEFFDLRRMYGVEVDEVFHSINKAYILRDDDICIIESMGYNNNEYLELDTDHNIKQKDLVFTIGYPAIPKNDIIGPIKMLITGIIRGFQKITSEDLLLPETYPLLNKELPVFGRFTIPGQSGSPVFNEERKVIGVIVLRNRENLGIFTPITNLVKYLDSIQ